MQMCKYCRAFSVADEALLEHEKAHGCEFDQDCHTAGGLRALVNLEEQRMLANCPGGDCGGAS